MSCCFLGWCGLFGHSFMRELIESEERTSIKRKYRTPWKCGVFAALSTGGFPAAVYTTTAGTRLAVRGSA